MDVSRKVLRIEQEQYRTLQGFYDSAPFLMGIAELDGDTIVAVSGNRAVADFFSVSPDALSGRMGRDFGNTPEMEKLWVNHYRMAQTQGRPVSFRFSTVNDQGLRWLTATVVHIGEGKTGRPQFSFVAEDFSERKKVDDALAASEQRFRSIFDHAAVGVAEIALDGRWLRANAHLCAMLGVTEAELLQLTSPNVTHPADVQADLYQRHRLLAGEIETYTLEKRYIRKDGALIWVEQAMSLVRDSQQSRAHFISVVQNISARKAVESALRESQERLAVAIETAKLSVYEFDIPNQKLHWDDRIREIWGYGSSEDVTYEAFLAGVHPDERARVEEAEERARDPNGPGRFEMTYRVINRKTGAVHWVHDTSQILFEDGRPVRMLGITQDVTADKRAEARLAQSEARFRAAVQAVSGNVWSNNAQGEMEGEQPGWAALTGQSFEEYQGYGWSRAVHPDDAQPTIDAWQAAVEAHRTFAFEHRVRRRDGVYRRFAIRALPVLSEDGEVQEWVGVHTDVTEQRDAEAILGRDREQLEQSGRNAAAAGPCSADGGARPAGRRHRP
jgi:PAS domain S-box-containing protein